jgi:hypothetical protein
MIVARNLDNVIACNLRSAFYVLAITSEWL